LNAEGIARDHMSFRFSISCPVPEILAIKVRSGTKSPEILHVCAPPPFLGGVPPPRIFGLNLGYLIEPVSDHVAKFHGDRSRDGGGNLQWRNKKKKHHEHFISPPVTTYGRPNKFQELVLILN